MAIVDLLGAFLHAENDRDVIMFMRRRLAELMTGTKGSICKGSKGTRWNAKKHLIILQEIKK